MAQIDDLKKKFDTGSTGERLQAMSSLLVLAGINETQAEKFVQANISIFGTELRTLGFSLENPLIAFLQQYNTSKKNIDPFLNSDNWSSLHDMYAKNLVDEKQLNFTCDEINKIKILVNDHFWNDTKAIDREWYINLWEWCASREPQNNILNDFALLLFSNVTESDIKKLDNWGRIEGDLGWEDALKNIQDKLKDINFSTFENADKLRKCLLFSDVLKKYSTQMKNIRSILNDLDKNLDTYNKLLLDKEKYKDDDTGAVDTIDSYIEQYEKEIKKLVNQYSTFLINSINKFNEELNPTEIFAESAPLLPTNTTNDIIRFLNEKVNLSNRDVLGRFRSKDTLANNRETNNNERKNNASSKQIPYMDKNQIEKNLNKLGIQNADNFINSLLRDQTPKRTLRNIINALENVGGQYL